MTIAAENAMISGDEYPGLSQLHLQSEQFALLPHNGFLTSEQRHGKLRDKLRLREDSGRQIVRWIPPHLVDQVRSELEVLQAGRRVMRKLRESTNDVRRAQRECRVELEPVLIALGYRFHGNSIRRRRRTACHVSQFPV
jgi:hypothetical protein